MIDSHCHPDDAAFANDRGAMLARAAEKLEGIVAIDGTAEVEGLKIWSTVGIHPHEAANAAARWDQLEATVAEDRQTDRPTDRQTPLIAIGEIGLDYHYDNSPRPTQIAVFERQLALAAAHHLPVSVHCREAWDDGFAAIRNQPGIRGVFHCFTGGQREAEQALALGWYLSFSGILTFPKLEALRAVAAGAPPDRILVETDAPYLAPVPHRGQRNEPAWVWDTARKLAACRNISLEEIEALTSANFYRLFPLAQPSHAPRTG